MFTGASGPNNDDGAVGCSYVLAMIELNVFFFSKCGFQCMQPLSVARRHILVGMCLGFFLRYLTVICLLIVCVRQVFELSIFCNGILLFFKSILSDTLVWLILIGFLSWG